MRIELYHETQIPFRGYRPVCGGAHGRLFTIEQGARRSSATGKAGGDKND
jgi:hypothetical protein